jgi:hypothetical protein
MMLERALALTARGWAVFTLQLGSKTPYSGLRWRTAATSDEARTREAWKRHPAANIGVATGSASGFWVLDVDGHLGMESLGRLIRAFGSIPRTFVVRTGKGLHYYFALPSGVVVRNRAGTICLPGSSTPLSGLDDRGEGGYVVGPGSIHASGRTYTIAINEELVLAPDWLIALVTDRETTAAREPEPTVHVMGLDRLQRAALESAIDRIRTATRPVGRPGAPDYQPGTRNSTFNREVHGLARTRASRHIVEPALKYAAREAGLDNAAIDRTFESAWTAGMRASPLRRRAPQRRFGAGR